MRLGSRLWVETSKTGEPKWNNLDIDWNLFSNDSEDLIEDIEIKPVTGRRKNDDKSCGTNIFIYALSSVWSKEKLDKIAVEEFSKLKDPFTPRVQFMISILFNGEGINIPRFDKVLFKAAHAKVTANYSVYNGEPKLVGKIEYLLRDREKSFSLDMWDLRSIIEGMRASSLRTIGPFSMVFYWFNRQVLQRIDDVFHKRRVQKLVADLAGGLMVFRDGFRVYPYGSPDDDWIDLDRKALSAAGYKVNRRQIIGKVDISSLENAALVDQTNREGLRDCDEKTSLVKMLKHILEAEFRAFLNKVDAEVQAKLPVTFEDLDDRVGVEEKRIRRSLKLLAQKFPAVKKDKKIFSSIEDSIEKIRSLMDEAQGLAESFESGHSKLLNLAGLGLMVEIIAHELNRTTRHTLKTLSEKGQLTLDEDVEGVFDTLEAQLKTLQKRLRILDPMSTSGRQVKEWFDLIEWTEEILSSHEAQFVRHEIEYYIKIKPSRTNIKFRVKMVKGMVAQIVENLLSNSVYWLKQKAIVENDFEPEIIITIDYPAKKLFISLIMVQVFHPLAKKKYFNLLLPLNLQAKAKGLDYLSHAKSQNIIKHPYICLNETSVHNDRLNTFVFSLEDDSK